MNTQDIIKVLAEKGFDISELEVQSKIDAFSRAFRLPAEEAARAALSHFMSINKLSPAPAKSNRSVPAQTGQNHTQAAVSAPAQVLDAPYDVYDKVFGLIIKLSSRAPYRLASCAEVVKEAASVGITPIEVEETIKALIEKGKCIEPLIGQLYPIEKQIKAPLGVLPTAPN